MLLSIKTKKGRKDKIVTTKHGIPVTPIVTNRPTLKYRSDEHTNIEQLHWYQPESITDILKVPQAPLEYRNN